MLTQMLYSVAASSGGSSGIYYRTFTIDHTQVPSTLFNFPVLVSVTDSTLSTLGHVESAAGFDIGFFSDSAGTTPLKWEVEKYVNITGNLIAWVKVPSISSSVDTVFYMRYGDPAITTDQSDPTNVWDANYLSVWHMNDNAGTTTILKSTTTGANATNIANTSTKSVTGQTGLGLTYNGTTDASSAVFAINVPVITLSFWLNWTTFANNDKLAFEYTANFNNSTIHGFIVDPNAGAGAWEFGSGDGSSDYWTDSMTRPSAGTFHLVHLVMDNNTPLNKAYIDSTSQTLTTKTHTLGAGGSFGSSMLNFMSRNVASLFGGGILDEVRVSTTERSSNWITAEWNNQKTSSTFLVMGSEVQL